LPKIAAKLYQRLSNVFSKFFGAIFRKIRKTKSSEKFDFFFEKNQV
jgi:hypothetical protein